MKKTLVPILFAVFSLAILDTKAQAIDEVKCKLTELDSFDTKIAYRFVNGQMDTINQKLKKNYSAFKPCQINTYRAIYTSKKGVELSNENIKTLATGYRWEHEPEKQNELIIEYEPMSPCNKERLISLSTNKSLTAEWKRTVTTGVIENESQVWMHPFRSNQYVFTEIAPFPEIVLPVRVGIKWSNEIHVIDGWGTYSNTVSKQKYKIAEIAARDYPFGSLENCVKVSAVTSNSKFGKSKLEFWYHEDYGFVEFNYENFKGEKLRIVLQGMEMMED